MELSNPISISAFILVGSLKDLSIIDFSSKNVICLNLASERLKEISDKYKPVVEETYSLYKTIISDAKRISDEPEYIHVLVPQDFAKLVKDVDYLDCINVIKLIYPSDLQYYAIASYNLYEDHSIDWIASTRYNFYPSGNDRYDNYLSYPFETEIVFLNNFIPIFFERINKLKYVQIAFDAYLNSFRNLPDHMAFISLCMSLETVVSGTTEITYKIRRTVALICADNLRYANIIYENVNLIYNLRSKIVHGAEIERNLINKYLPYLRDLVSRMIVQLIYLNQTSVKELEKIFLFISIDNRNDLFNDQKKILNTFSYFNTFKSLK